MTMCIGERTVLESAVDDVDVLAPTYRSSIEESGMVELLVTVHVRTGHVDHACYSMIHRQHAQKTL